MAARAATTVAEAHHSERAGEEPILPARYIESGCGQCHQNALPGTPQLNLGRTMLTRYGCVHCHAITRPDGTRWRPRIILRRSRTSPTRRRASGSYSWLKDPQAYAASTTMPNYKLSDADASDISAYLVSTSTPQAGDTAAAAPSLRQAPIRRRTKPVWRIVLRLLPRRSECGGQPGGRRPGPGTDAHRQQGKAGVAGGMASESRASTMPQRPCRTTASRRSRSRFWLLICRQVGFRLRLGRSSGCGQPAADCPRTKAHRRAGMRGLPRDQRRAEAGELRARTQHHRKQAAGADRLPARHGTHAVQLHRGQDPSAASLRRQRQDAAVHADRCADRCVDHALLALTSRGRSMPDNLRVAAFRRRTTSLPGTRAS
jgi:hypothetical protein